MSILLSKVLLNYSMKKLYAIIFVCAFALFYISCSDILEEDISNLKINVIVPCDSCEITSSQVIFLWDSVSGANRYKVQLVQPNFANATSVVFDTIVTRCTLNSQLTNGDYEWRIRAENSAYTTSYLIQSFKVAVQQEVDTNSVAL